MNAQGAVASARRTLVGVVATVAVAAACVVVGATPADAARHNFYSYKYGPCGAVKSQTRSFVTTSGSLARNTAKNKVTLDTFQGEHITYTCGSTTRSSVDKLRVGLKFVAYGVKFTTITVSWPGGSASIELTRVESNYFWGSWRSKNSYTAVTETGNYVTGTKATYFTDIDMIARGEAEHGVKTNGINALAQIDMN